MIEKPLEGDISQEILFGSTLLPFQKGDVPNSTDLGKDRMKCEKFCQMSHTAFSW